MALGNHLAGEGASARARFSVPRERLPPLDCQAFHLSLRQPVVRRARPHQGALRGRPGLRSYCRKANEENLRTRTGQPWHRVINRIVKEAIRRTYPVIPLERHYQKLQREVPNCLPCFFPYSESSVRRFAWTKAKRNEIHRRHANMRITRNIVC